MRPNRRSRLAPRFLFPRAERDSSLPGFVQRCRQRHRLSPVVGLALAGGDEFQKGNT